MDAERHLVMTPKELPTAARIARRLPLRGEATRVGGTGTRLYKDPK